MWGARLRRLFRFGFRRQEPRLQIDWMTHTDERILDILAAADTDESMNPQALAERLNRSPEYVADRCRRLQTRELLTGDGRTGYRLAPLGRRYRSGDVDPAVLSDTNST